MSSPPGRPRDAIHRRSRLRPMRDGYVNVQHLPSLPRWRRRGSLGGGSAYQAAPLRWRPRLTSPVHSKAPAYRVRPGRPRWEDQQASVMLSSVVPRVCTPEKPRAERQEKPLVHRSAIVRFHSEDQISASASATISPPRGAWMSISGSGLASASSAGMFESVTTAP